MKSYAPNDIKSRMARKLRNYANWDKIVEDSAIDSILTAFSEIQSESNRYLEHLTREKTWEYAQNITSILGQTNFFGYKPRRKVSSIGTVYFSHDISINSLTSKAELDNLSEYTGSPIDIPIETSMLIGGIPFITTKSVIYETGFKYIAIPVIQGQVKRISTFPQTTLGVPFEILRINNPNIEAANDDVSKTFFNVYATLPSGEASIACVEVENILLADEDTYAYEIRNVLNDDGDDYIEIKFGNNVSGVQFPKNTRIEVSFLETLGSEGNIVEKNIASGVISFANSVLYYDNLDALLGGKDRATLEEIKAEAPESYLLEGSIITAEQYKKAVLNLPNIDKAVVYGDVITDPYTLTTREAVGFSAVRTDGEAPDKTEIETQLLDRIYDKKSPLDIISYVYPNFLDIVINYQAELQIGMNKDPNLIKSNIKNLILDNYSIHNIEFGESIVKDKITSLVFENTEPNLILSSNCFIESKKILKPSTFERNLDGDYYERAFSFDSSYGKIRHDVPICILRFDFIWYCSNCQDKNRTVFVFKNEKYDDTDPVSPYFVVKQYPLITEIITEDYMNLIIKNPLIEPQEILPTDSEYIPFDIQFSKASALADTTLRIPVSSNYIQFDNFTPTELDADMVIHCLAYPTNYNSNNIVPLTRNSIFNITENDVKVGVM
jgi:hypothetical protein